MRSIIQFNLALVTLCAATASYAAQHEALISAPGATISVEFESPVEDTKSREIVAWIEHVAEQVSMPYGRVPVAAARVLIIPTRPTSRKSDSPVPFGRVTRSDGETVELYVNVDRPIDAMYADWTATHEFSHLLLPPISWRQKWISEGFASYYQNVLMARAGRYSPDGAVRRLSEGFDRGRNSRPELSPNDAAEQGVRRARYKIYWSGAAIALLADIRLREQSGGKESLDTVLGRFQQCCLPSKKRWSGIEFFTRLDSLLETPVFMPLYRQYANTPGFPETDEALSKPLLREQIFAVRTSPH